MAYTPTNWSAGDEITSDKLNKIEKGIKDGSTIAGPAGKDGVSLTALALVLDSDGKITGGTATLSDKSTIDVTVTTA